MEKNGMLTEKSLSDFNSTKKAEYFDLDGFAVSDEENKQKLANPKPIKEILEPEE
jgi:hypothetical protein